MFDDLENIAELVYTVREYLSQEGIVLGEGSVTLLQRHVDLVREWNRVVGVVSTSEVERLWERQVVDSLSLAAVVNRLG
ncbi:MAG: hypothetical protein FJY92_07990, partial [Candidatus Hydrogenedentes bacterium]|nr:hypothetical protein [Candidatus Hydrogenedentota bacterium]